MAIETDRPARQGELLASRIAQVCADILRLPSFGIESDFFAAGGDSLGAAQLTGALARQDPGHKIADLIGAVFSGRTPAAIAAALSQPSVAGPRVAGPSRWDTQSQPAAGTELPLSPLQSAIWVSERFRPGTPKWTIATAVHLRGPIDASRMLAAVRACIVRHEALRTRIIRRGKAFVQSFDARPEPIAEGRLLLPASEPERAIALRAILDEEVSRPFHTDTGPLFRVRLIEVGETEWLLLLAAHHVVMDGWSVSVLLREIAAAYRGDLFAEAQGGHYAALLRDWPGSASADLSRSLAYWSARFPRGWPGADALYDQPGATEPDAAVAARDPLAQRLALPAEIFRALARNCADHGATPFVAALAAFGTVLARRAGVSELAVNVAVSRRNSASAASLVGLFLNAVPALVPARPGRPFREIVVETNRLWLESVPFQDAPFADIQRELAAKRLPPSALHLPFVINFHNYPADEFDIPGVEARIEHLAIGHTPADLALNVRPMRDGAAELELLLMTSRISTAAATDILRDIAALLESFAA